MIKIEGVLTGSFSEKVIEAPVVASILQDDNTHKSISLDRRCWNDFVDSNSTMYFGRTRVVVEGEDEFNCGISLAEEDPFDELRRAGMGA